MSVTTAPAPPGSHLELPAETGHAAGNGQLPEPAERGRLTIDDRVVEKVAARAVTEIDRATGAPRTLFGQSLGSVRADTPARTSARVDGDIVTVTVSMSVQWPAPIREVAAQLRHRVTDRVQAITGLTVAEVDIDVPTLLTARPSTPRVR